MIHPISIKLPSGTIYKKLDHYKVKPDQRTKRFNFRVRWVAPDPAIFPLSTLNGEPDTTFAYFYERWQWFACDVLAMSKYNKYFWDLDRPQKNFIVSAFTAICGSDKVLHNNQGVDRYNNYPKGEFVLDDGTPKGDDPKQESLRFALEDVYSAEAPRINSKGRKMVNLLSYYYNEAPPKLTPRLLEDPRIAELIIINQDGTFQQFPQLTEDPNSPVIVRFPIITRGFDYSWYPHDEMDFIS
jgi:hypothetical protein